MESYIPYLFLLGRIMYGGFFIKSGVSHFRNHQALVGYAASKGVPMPKAAVYLSGLMMILAGFYIVFGVLVAWGILFIVLSLGVITYKMHAFWKETDPQARMISEINFWKNIALIGAALMLLATLSTLAPHWPLAI